MPSFFCHNPPLDHEFGLGQISLAFDGGNRIKEFLWDVRSCFFPVSSFSNASGVVFCLQNLLPLFFKATKIN